MCTFSGWAVRGAARAAELRPGQSGIRVGPGKALC